MLWISHYLLFGPKKSRKSQEHLKWQHNFSYLLLQTRQDRSQKKMRKG